ncbi:MAG TPA: DUF1598 domain-containing protein [Pirellulaceae bacterium]|jgi:hypothetical protein
MARWNFARRSRYVRLALASAYLVFMAAPLAFAGDPTTDVAARLAAGEFGPAIEAASAIKDPAVRDNALANVAAKQAKSGARRAALETVGDVSSDLARKSILSSMAASYGPNTKNNTGARGGAAMADFDSLIELITTTLKPDSWDDVGGPGAVDQFAGGVYVDAIGLLQKLPPNTNRSLVALHKASLEAGQTSDPRREAGLRKVSLTRLEREVQLLHAQGRDPSEAMQTLAGLKRVKYLLVYPESGDIVIAGPAGNWHRDLEGRFVDDSGAPVLNLDDLVVTLRNSLTDNGRFGCSINPRQDNLAAAKAVNDKWSKEPLKTGQRQKWLAEFRDAMGQQDITVHGIDPRTRAGRILIEADYRMKLVGIGLEEGTLGVASYLSTVEAAKDGNPLPMNVLRWWFTLNYDALAATDKRDAFELRGPGVKVLSENEMLTERGERVHTGDSDELTKRFADSFTKHFDKLAVKYPIYAELRNVFDLALVAAVIQSHDLAGQVGWHMTHFGPNGEYSPILATAPKEVESVMNHRVIGNKHVIAAVSGGVRVETSTVAAKDTVKTDASGSISSDRNANQPKQLDRRTWWWD